MKTICYVVTLVSGLLSATFLVFNRIKGWDLPLIETLSWVVLVLDVFLVFVRFQVLDEMCRTRDDILGLLGISNPADVSHPIVRKHSQKALSSITRSLKQYKDLSIYEIDNPYVARDISFELIRTVPKDASIWATMNLVARPFLLKDTYTSYFVGLHQDALKGKRTHVAFTRVLVIDNSVASAGDSAAYNRFKASLEELGIRVLEASPPIMTEHGLSSDILIRTTGTSTSDRACLIGDKDPTNPLDPYTARLLVGNCQQIDNWLDKIKALCRQLDGEKS